PRSGRAGHRARVIASQWWDKGHPAPIATNSYFFRLATGAPACPTYRLPRDRLWGVLQLNAHVESAPRSEGSKWESPLCQYPLRAQAMESCSLLCFSDNEW
ncbi:MAG: hypothetical protein ACRD1T_19650, partial [Acidimicrobiia bacterium]